MTTLLIIGGYLFIGFVSMIVLGRRGEFDYYPKYNEIGPGAMKYVVLLLWPMVFGIALLEFLFKDMWIGLNGWLNKLARARVDKH